MKLLIFFAVVVVVSAQYDSPVPPRPVIPGAIPARVTLRRRQQFQSDEIPGQRRQQYQPDEIPVQRRQGGRGGQRRLITPTLLDQVQRPRPALFQDQPVRPPPPPASIAPRPVIEEEEEEDEIISTPSPTTPPQPSPPSFRPIPEDFPQPSRQQYKPQPIEEEPVQYVRKPRPQPVQNTIYQEERNQPERHRPSQQYNKPIQPSRQQIAKPVQKQVVHNKDEPSQRPRKATAQILKKYRDENEDGSITWGFENDDGTFKEETIGVDCVTYGKYGYVDPDGVRREYSYSSGIPCNKPDADTQASDNNEGYIDYTNNKYVFPNGDTINLDNMVRNRARKQPIYRN